MNLNEYQKQAMQTAIYPDIGNNVVYPVLGLLCETGELIDKIKKIMRDGPGELTSKRQLGYMKEIGDICWYVSVLLKELGIEFADVMYGDAETLGELQVALLRVGSNSEFFKHAIQLGITTGDIAQKVIIPYDGTV